MTDIIGKLKTRGTLIARCRFRLPIIYLQIGHSRESGNLDKKLSLDARLHGHDNESY